MMHLTNLLIRLPETLSPASRRLFRRYRGRVGLKAEALVLILKDLADSRQCKSCLLMYEPASWNSKGSRDLELLFFCAGKLQTVV
jgi:hypothetical protein